MSFLVFMWRTMCYKHCHLPKGCPGLHTSSIKCTESTNVDREKKTALLKLEMEMERQSGNFFIPNKIEDQKWEELFKISDPQQRRSYYRYLKKIELDEARIKRRHGQDVEQRRNKLKELNVDRKDVTYGLGKNSLFLKVANRSLYKIYITNLLHAVTFGQKVVFDMEYEYMMNNHELTNTISQIVHAYAAVKRDKEAFYLHFCNIPCNGRTEQKLKLAIPPLQEPKPLVELTQKSYLDLFPRERLVYLVPDCGVDLRYDPEDIYIIGGIVDRRGQGPVSLAKAKREGLRMAEFPLRKYLQWRSGSKTLTLDQVVNILKTLRDTQDWEMTLKQHVPQRKVYAENDDGEITLSERVLKKSKLV